jgi:proteasome assembly chaperone (PAC2) family protein
MADELELWETPHADEVYMLAGWHQWADAGSVSSALPHYWIKRLDARKIGEIRPDGFYIFQVPGTHDLVRPVVQFEDGFPVSLEAPVNEIFYSGDEHRGLVIFTGEEPHLDIERYARAFLQIARRLGVKRIVSLGGVYGELPYDKERIVSCIYSKTSLKPEIATLSVGLSDYHGGASIGSYLCRRAGEQDIEFTGFYAFVPAYDFSSLGLSANAIRIETDYMAWLAVMQRINYMLQLNLDLSHLEKKSRQLIDVLDEKISEIEEQAGGEGVRDYLEKLSESFEETPFDPAGDFWEQELRDIFSKLDDQDDDNSEESEDEG